MATPSDSQIDEAKERVRQMYSRSRQYVDDNSEKVNDEEDKRSSENAPKESEKQKDFNFDFECGKKYDDIADDGKFENESMIILMLVMLLSNEGADSMLLLALLYLLF